MSEETKYKAWIEPSYRSKHKGQMVNWDTIFSTWGVADLFGKVGTIPLQYTGLKDKNGKEIYEGDRVNLIPEGYAVVPAIVEWSDKELRWTCQRPETGTGMYLASDSNFEVIGNIYEEASK